MADGRATLETRHRELADYLNQLTSLAVGSIVVVATFSTTSGGERAGRTFAIVGVSSFALTIALAMIARITMLFLAHGEVSDHEEGALVTAAAYCVVLALFAFAVGVVTLAVYAALGM